MRIKEARDLMGLTQEAFAREMNFSVRSVANWERTERTTDQLHPLAKKELERLLKKHGVIRTNGG